MCDVSDTGSYSGTSVGDEGDHLSYAGVVIGNEGVVIGDEGVVIVAVVVVLRKVQGALGIGASDKTTEFWNGGGSEFWNGGGSQELQVVDWARNWEARGSSDLAWFISPASC